MRVLSSASRWRFTYQTAYHRLFTLRSIPNRLELAIKFLEKRGLAPCNHRLRAIMTTYLVICITCSNRIILHLVGVIHIAAVHIFKIDAINGRAMWFFDYLNSNWIFEASKSINWWATARWFRLLWLLHFMIDFHLVNLFRIKSIYIN